MSALSWTPASNRRNRLTALLLRAGDIIALNRALAAALTGDGGPLRPGELNTALREGRVTVKVAPAPAGNH